jgi:hypothetical protein
VSVAAHRANVVRAIARRLAPKDSSITGLYRVPRFLECEAGKNVAQAAEELLWNERGVAKRDQRRHIADAVLREDVLLFEKARFDVLRRRRDTRAGERGDHVPVQVRRQRVDHGREQHVDLVAPVAREELAVVAVDALHWVAAVDGAASLAEPASLIFRAVRGELEPAWIYAERTEETDPELVR